MSALSLDKSRNGVKNRLVIMSLLMRLVLFRKNKSLKWDDYVVSSTNDLSIGEADKPTGTPLARVQRRVLINQSSEEWSD